LEFPSVIRQSNWFLTLRDEHRLRVFENRVLRRIFGPKREEVAEGWRKLHSEELHNLNTYPNTIQVIKPRRMGWAGHVSCMREMGNAYSILVGKSEGNKPLGRSRHRWEDNIRMDLSDIEWEVVDWIHLPQIRD